ncbi:uncharacterized protein BDR25DRAFT_302371 [Lindgomyces ingoldianus]|uniref:Uncharacterized protein n=1 Tax=Lindgomyces ingoldianus TaxID=673940 RepID=A0ACB6R2M1_9PLEO|nr:uncharacterized protein BDR25DRAFT_302371 [Lindgomyces ingoldianus]KAF2473504.1 hypothetical protein BDR25DRAFT_302371 [Lindgomyces ingoldianus]
MEAQKLKKKLNGSTLKGSKVRIEDAKPEKRKAADGAEEVGGEEIRAAKRARKEKRKREQGVLEGAELEGGRKVKRGWTEPPLKSKKEKKEQKPSKYTKEPEMLFKAKLIPVAATEVARKEKKEKKKDKKDKKKSKEVVVHEFEKSTKQPSFLKSVAVSTMKKPATEYVDGKGWVDEDGNVVEPETGKARNRRVLELVDAPPKEEVSRASKSPRPTTEKKPSATPDPEPSTAKSKAQKIVKTKKPTPLLSSSEPDSDVQESSDVSSPSDDDVSSAESSASSPALAPDVPSMTVIPSSPEDKKEIHPLEALFKRPRLSPPSTSGSNLTATPAKGLAPINTSFSFFDKDTMSVDGGGPNNPPVTPFTKQDLEWRGLRSAAPTPDTAAIGRRFSFPWRKGSHEVDDDEEDEDDDLEAGKQLSSNTKINASSSRVPDAIAEEEEDEDEGANSDQENEDEENSDPDVDANSTLLGKKKGANGVEGEKEESEFQKWFWENRGENNRAWKKRRREGLKSKRLRENRKITGTRRVG